MIGLIFGIVDVIILALLWIGPLRELKGLMMLATVKLVYIIWITFYPLFKK